MLGLMKKEMKNFFLYIIFVYPVATVSWLVVEDMPFLVLIVIQCTLQYLLVIT
ncbi:MAG: hypothetical protein GY757_29170, partial [bacterium]|nr:hypothetical protein [bacterium]